MFPQSESTLCRRAQFKQKNLPSSLCYSTRALTTVAERRERKKKINAVKCGDRKMSFWQMQGFVYAQIEFWWISPQARPPFLIYRLSYKNVKQWCYRKQIQMSLAHRLLQWTSSFFFLLWEIFSLGAIWCQLKRLFLEGGKTASHRTSIFICPVMGVFAWENQCKWICISSNRSLSIFPSDWCS